MPLVSYYIISLIFYKARPVPGDVENGFRIYVLKCWKGHNYNLVTNLWLKKEN